MGNFLDSLTGGSGLAGSAFNTLVAGATGGFKDRPQWRDMQFMNDVTNRLWPDEIKRNQQFMQGMAPYEGERMYELAGWEGASQQKIAPYSAAAYNEYQNLTAGEDARRQTEKIQTMSQGLGMSPWELAGNSGGSVPLPSGDAPHASGSSPNQGQNQLGTYLQGVMPLKIAKIQAATQLMQTKMQTDTQLKSSGVTPQKGSVQEQQRLQIAAQTLQQESGAALAGAQTSAVHNDMFIKNLQTVISLLPDFETGVPGAKMRGKSGGGPILQALKQATSGYKDPDDALKNAISKLPTDRWKQLKPEVDALIKGAGQVGAGAADEVGKFLKSLID